MSDAERFRRLETRFNELIELSPSVRGRRLSDIRSSEPELIGELLAMLGDTLSEQDQPVDKLMQLADEMVAADAPIPETIGPYRIVAVLGQGGMGRVYEAEQTEPMQRAVALKVARDGAKSEASRARFLAERQTLALLDHPNIAKIFDAGSAEDGQLWFAMELVRGEPITHWADRRALNLRQRIQLMLPVCEAIQHAHQKGMIHRDLKPRNLLVVDDGGIGQPKVIDFGIAKAIASADESTAYSTRIGEAVGTPEYMSPEQASLGEIDIDTRTDVYALGLVLHELLVGRLPLDPDTLRSASFGEICRRIREDPTALPSRLASRTGGASASITLKGDLDLVLLKALAKDREQRYESAAALADDLQRYLQQLPVRAAPPLWHYRAGKFIRRHRVPVALASAASVGLLMLTAAALWQADIAASERDRAQAEAQRSTTVLAFFQDMLASADPARAQGRDLSVRELLDQTRDQLPDTALDLQARAVVEETLATTYNALGLPEEGLPLAQAASARLRSALGADHPMTLSAQHAEARFYNYLGQFDQAIELLETTLAARERVLGLHMDTASSLHNLAYAYAERGDIEHALQLDQRQLQMVEALTGPESEEALVTMSSIAHGYMVLGRYREASDMLEHILSGHRRYLGERHPMTLSVLHNLAFLAKQRGEFDYAEARYLELIELRREVLGSHHAQTLNTLSNLGSLYFDLGRYAQAAPFWAESLAGRLATLGPDHPDTLSSRLAGVRLSLAMGGADGVLDEVRAVYDLALGTLGTDSPITQRAADLLEQLTTMQGVH